MVGGIYTHATPPLDPPLGLLLLPQVPHAAKCHPVPMALPSAMINI